MKQTKLFALALLLLALLSTLTACGTKYCTVSGCPKEAARGCNYCYSHKCANTSCKNKGALTNTPYSYCMECIERAQ